MRESVEGVRAKNAAAAEILRLKLEGIREEKKANQSAWQAHGRQRVDHDKDVLAPSIKDRQNSARGRRQRDGEQTKRELAFRAVERQAALS